MNSIQLTCDQKNCIYCDYYGDPRIGSCCCEKKLDKISKKFMEMQQEDPSINLTDFEEDFMPRSLCPEYEFNLLDTPLKKEWKELSRFSCDPDIGKEIIQFYNRERGYTYYTIVANEKAQDDRIALNRALKKMNDQLFSCPKWTELPKEILKEMLIAPFEMRYIDEDDLSIADMIQLKDLIKRYPYLRDVFCFDEDSSCLTIYAGAMCKIRWELHEEYGNQPYIRLKKEKLCEEFFEILLRMMSDSWVKYHKIKEELEDEILRFHSIDYHRAMNLLIAEEHMTSEKASQIIFSFLIRKDMDNLQKDVRNYARKVFLNENV